MVRVMVDSFFDNDGGQTPKMDYLELDPYFP
jgi:hypothetical protein